MGTPRLFQFEPFVLDARAQALFRNGLRVKLTGQPYQILQILLERAGEVVTREELRELLWPEGTFVDFQRCLSTSIMTLRRVLHDTADAPRYIATVQRVGYRFVAPVTTTDEELGLPASRMSVVGGRNVEGIGEVSGNTMVPSLVNLRVKQYALGAVVALAALSLRKLLDPYLGTHYHFLMSWFAVVLSARYWGIGPAIATTITGALGVWYFLLPPAYSFRLQDPAEIYGLVGFIALSISIVWLASAGPSKSFQD